MPPNTKCVHHCFKCMWPLRAPRSPLSIRQGSCILFLHSDLGILGDTRLRFHTHISNTVRKAGGVFCDLLRPTTCRPPSLMIISDTQPFLLPGILNSGRILSCSNWFSAAAPSKFTTCHSFCTQDRLSQLNLFPVKVRLLCADLLQCYKIFHNLSTVTASDLFLLAPRRNRGFQYNIFVPHSSTEAPK